MTKVSKCNKIRYNTCPEMMILRWKISKWTTGLSWLLKSVNIFVIFCNFPIDEMRFMGYNACMKKCRSEHPDQKPVHEAGKIFSVLNH